MTPSTIPVRIAESQSRSVTRITDARLELRREEPERVGEEPELVGRGRSRIEVVLAAREALGGRRHQSERARGELGREEAEAEREDEREERREEEPALHREDERADVGERRAEAQDEPVNRRHAT